MSNPIPVEKLEPWRGDYDNLSNFVNKSWGYSYKNTSSFYFTKDYLQWFMENPIDDKKYQFATYQGNELLTFTSFSKRNYRYQDKVIPGLFATFAAIEPDYMRKKNYYTLGLEVLKILRAEYQLKGEPEIICYYLDHTQPTYQLFSKLGRETGIAFQTICRAKLRAKVFDAAQLEQVENVKFYEKLFIKLMNGIKKYDDRYDKNIMFYEKNNLTDCYSLANIATQRQVFAPHFSMEELDHYFSFRNFSKTLVFVESNSVKGFITYRLMDIYGKNNMKKMALIDWISDQQLNKEERKALVMRCLSEIKKAGCITVMFADLPFLKNSSLNSGGFLPSPRDAYLCCYNFVPEKYNLENIKNAYDILS